MASMQPVPKSGKAGGFLPKPTKVTRADLPGHQLPYLPHPLNLTRAALNKATPFSLRPAGGKVTRPRPAPHDLPLPGPKNDLKPTPGKTPLPPKGVLPPVPPKTQRPSYTAAQEATMHAKALLAPQYAQANVEADRQNKAIQAYTTAVMQQLAGVAPQIGQDYNSAIDAQSGLVNSAADSLRAANPNGDAQKLLDAVGAPQSQHDATASNLANVFNGGAAVTQYNQGVLPLGALRSQGLASETLARLAPGNAALGGRQSLLAALGQQSDTRAKIGEQLPGLSQDWLNAFQSNKAKAQQIALEQNALGLKQANTDRSFKAQQDKYLRDYNLNVTKFNAKQTSDAAKAAAPNASLSRANGYLTDASGAPILDSNGKRQILPGFNTNAQGRVVKSGSKSGGVKPASVSQVNTFLKGIPKYKTVRTVDGAGGSTSTKQSDGYTMTYMSAYRRLRSMGLDDKTTRGDLDSVYPRGAGGRSWLTNVEQSVLRKAASSRGEGKYIGLKGAQAGDITKVNLDPVSHHRFLSPIQYQILKTSGNLPPGAFQDTPLGKRWYIAQ